MAAGNRQRYVQVGGDSALASMASGLNPDGSTFSLNTAPVSSAPAVASIGFSVTAAAGGTTLPAQACHAVNIQNRNTADDGITAQTKDIWVIVGGVKMFELTNGQSVTVKTTNANLISVMSFSGTSLVSGSIEP